MLVYFFWGCNKEANHKIRFPPLFIYLFIFPAILFVFFLCKFGFIKKNVKRGAALSEWADFCRVVPQTVLYLPVKFRDNPSFVWRSMADLVLGFNRRHVRVLCFLGQKP